MVEWKRLTHRLGVALNLREPPTLPAHGWSYFDHMVAVYLTLNVADPRATAVIQKAESRPYGLTWGDIFLLEDIILQLAPVDTIARNAWMVRERFRETAGPTMWTKYVESGFPKDSDTPVKAALLRADLSRLLDFMHWYYALIPIRERKRKSLTITCVFMVVIYMVALVGALFYFGKYDHPFLAMASCVIFWGIIGGFVSSQRRMQNIPSDGDPLISVFGLENSGYYLWLSPLLGSIFAGVLTLMFIGGILQGIVFPTFVGAPAGAGHSLAVLTRWALPVGPGDYAKLYVWCFMAGFAERLVPDSLDRLASKLDTNKEPVSPGAPPPPPGGGGGGGGGGDGDGGDGDKGVRAPQVEKEKVPAEVVAAAMHTGEDPPPEPVPAVSV